MYLDPETEMNDHVRTEYVYSKILLEINSMPSNQNITKYYSRTIFNRTTDGQLAWFPVMPHEVICYIRMHEIL